MLVGSPALACSSAVSDTWSTPLKCSDCEWPRSRVKKKPLTFYSSDEHGRCWISTESRRSICCCWSQVQALCFHWDIAGTATAFPSSRMATGIYHSVRRRWQLHAVPSSTACPLFNLAWVLAPPRPLLVQVLSPTGPSCLRWNVSIYLSRSQWRSRTEMKPLGIIIKPPTSPPALHI